MPPERTNEPDVIFDVAFEEGLLFFELSNRAATPVTQIVTQFRQGVMGPDGATDLTQLAVFRKISFLAPGKSIRVFVDTAESYFARRQPNILGVVVTWSQSGKAMTTTISHDLRIYRDLPYVVGRGAEARRGVAFTEQAQSPRR